jgi:hypothetical protein
MDADIRDLFFGAVLLSDSGGASIRSPGIFDSGFIVAAFAIWGLYLGRFFIYNLVQRLFGAASSQELLELDAVDRIIELRRKIEREKDREAAQFLEAEVSKYEQMLAASKRTALWSTEGTLEVTWSEVLAVSRERLIEETRRLAARSRANLQIGITISSVGVGFVLYSLFFLPDINDRSTLTAQVLTYLPRLTLLVVIQLIGGFFLRMYVSNENDIKQNKNEITNLELKLAGTLLASEDRKTKSVIAELLVRNERNFILKRDEKVSGEAWKTEAEDLRGILGNLIEKMKIGTGSK